MVRSFHHLDTPHILLVVTVEPYSPTPAAGSFLKVHCTLPLMGPIHTLISSCPQPTPRRSRSPSLRRLLSSPSPLRLRSSPTPLRLHVAAPPLTHLTLLRSSDSDLAPTPTPTPLLRLRSSPSPHRSAPKHLRPTWPRRTLALPPSRLILLMQVLGENHHLA
jgi:hypothetical protein